MRYTVATSFLLQFTQHEANLCDSGSTKPSFHGKDWKKSRSDRLFLDQESNSRILENVSTTDNRIR